MTTFRLMRSSDIDAASACISESFTQHEPLTSFLQVPAHTFQDYVADICRQIVSQELSVIAEDASRILGVRLAARHHSYRVNTSLCAQMLIVTDLLDQLHALAKPHDQDERYCLQLIMMGVSKENNGRGIAQQLLQHTLENATLHHYQHAIVEATSPATRHIFNARFGFKTSAAIEYRNFRHQGETVLKDMPPSAYCTLLEKDL